MGQALLKPTGEESTSKELIRKESPKVTAERLYRNYEDTVKAYIESLAPLCLNLKTGEVFSIQWIEEGYVHAIYGDKHFYFPDEVVDKISLTDWRNAYDLEVDNKGVLVHNPMDMVPWKVESSFRRTAVDTFAPWIVQSTSKNTRINRSLRIKKRNKN
jgi:hypothetical protein